MRNLIRLAAIMLLFVASTSFATTPEEAASAVAARYRITTRTFFGDIKEVGSVLTPRREGLRAGRRNKAFNPNVIKNHQLAVAGGGDLPADVQEDALKPGKQLHLYGVQTGDDYVQLDLFTVASYLLTGMRSPMPLQASVRFQYDGGLAKVTTRQLLDDIDEWLVAERAPLPTVEGPHPTVAHPPQPPAFTPATPTVRLGQTQEEVIAILGRPDKQILLGAKSIFVYPGVKVIFVNGKVTDAE
jgi:hypothetical protein